MDSILASTFLTDLNNCFSWSNLFWLSESLLVSWLDCATLWGAIPGPPGPSEPPDPSAPPDPPDPSIPGSHSRLGLMDKL